MSSSGLFVVREPVFLDANLPKNQEDVNKTCANGGVFGVSGTKGAKPLRHAYGVPPPLPRGGLGIPQSFASSPEAPLLGELSPKVTERLYEGQPDRETQKKPPWSCSSLGAFHLVKSVELLTIPLLLYALPRKSQALHGKFTELTGRPRRNAPVSVSFRQKVCYTGLAVHPVILYGRG